MRTINGLLAPLCATALVGLAAFAVDASAQEFPYTGYVNAPNARLRSGPGTDHYSTNRLRIGQSLEVFRRDRGGWFAVRPIGESFSWVRGSALLATDDNEIAKVTEDDVIARVGSRFSQDQDVSHLSLSRGEKVQLLEPDKFEDQEGEDVWVKIRPPAGEFRWVSEKYIDRKPPVAEPKPGAVSRRTPRGPDATRDPTDKRHPGWRTRPPIRLTAGEEPAEDEEATTRKEEEEVAAKAKPTEDLATLELAVAKLLALPPREWDFKSLREKVEDVRRNSSDTAEQSSARRLLKRIDRYAGLKARFKDDAPRHIGKKIVPPIKLTTPPALFDFAGRLVPVVSRSRRPDAPKYALTDAKGQVICFLEESAAVGLSKYVDQHVAVSGRTTFVDRLKKDKVEVRRIVQKDPITFPAGQISHRPRGGTTRR